MQSLVKALRPALRPVFNRWPRWYSLSTEEQELLNSSRESDNFDVVIVGGGPSGLSAAIRIRQLCQEQGKDFRVCVVEKGPEIGSHILSGAVIEPRAMNELIPDWKQRGVPFDTPVVKDQMAFLTNDGFYMLPLTELQNNHGNYISSLGNVCRWLGEEAERLGVEIYPGFAASELLYDSENRITGIATRDSGIGKDGKPTELFQRGMELKAKVTLLGEGCRGSLAKQLYAKFPLRAKSDPASFGIGLKEIWEVPKEKHVKGLVTHTVGWPLDYSTYGGSFVYHWGENLVSIGFVVGLDYTNPYLNPYKTFQQFKTHPFIADMLRGGKCISYGARALNEGGIQALPQLAIPGVALMGCNAGFMNLPKIKGTHTAMKTGMLAAESAFEELSQSNDDSPVMLRNYEENVKKSWVWDELYAVRNVRPAFQRWGLLGGVLYTGIDSIILRGKAPWTMSLIHNDNETLKKASESKPIEYPKPDGVLSFDLLTNLARSGTNHNEDQEPHLKIINDSIPINVNLKEFAGPESRYCPAGVYEFVEGSDGNARLQINAQNCLHCKTCDIKDPTQNIRWTVPEGGGGPAYPNM